MSTKVARKGQKMKKPVKTYETKYPVNKQKSDYYGNCESGNGFICFSYMQGISGTYGETIW